MSNQNKEQCYKLVLIVLLKPRSTDQDEICSGAKDADVNANISTANQFVLWTVFYYYFPLCFD